MSKRTFLLFFIPALVLLFGFSQPVQASLAAGHLDSGFDPGTGADSIVYDSVQDREGNIYIVGDFTEIDGPTNPRSGIAKLWADGSLVPTANFDPGAGTNYEVRSVAIQDDGKIVIGGDFTTYNGTARSKIARLNTDGSLDTSFNPGTGANGDINEVVIQSDGKILIGGAFSSYDGTSRSRLARLNADGSLDTDFVPNSGPNNVVHALALTSGGRIYVGGTFTEVDAVSRNRIARVHTNGRLDTSFNPGTGANNNVFDIAVLHTGHIAIVGAFSEVNGLPRVRTAWLDSAGAVSTKFVSDVGANSTVWSVTAQPDGKIIIGGIFLQVDGIAQTRVARMDIYGEVDTTFDAGTGANSTVYDVTLQDDGKVLVGGNFTVMDGHARSRIARLHPDGTLDEGLDSGLGAGNPIYALETIKDQKMLIAGFFADYDGYVSLSNFARLNADGSFDTDFHTGSGPNDTVHASVLQDDGRKVILVGDFTQVGAVSRGRIARFDTDGYNDNTFNPGTGASADIYAVEIQDDDKILVGGSFATFNGVSRGRIERLNDNGTQDAGFNAGGVGANSYIREIAIQDDGKILAGGNFDTFNGVGASKIVRLNTNGTVDGTFITGTGFNNDGVTAIGFQSDGKIIVGGWFTSFNGTTGLTRITRLNTDGSLDTSFNPGTGLNNVPWEILIQPDDKILLVGGFQLVNGIARNRVARLNADGSLDTSFLPISGADNPVQDIKIQPGGKLAIVGTFSFYDGYTANTVARLNGGTMPTITTPTAPPDGEVGVSYGPHIYTATGFPSPKFYVISGDFPPGLRLNGTTGALYGTPTEPGTYTFILGAYNYLFSTDSQFNTININTHVYLPLILK